MERAPYLDDRWLSFTPNAAVEAFAVMEDNGSTTVDGEVVLQTKQYAAGNPNKVVYVNGPVDVASGHYGPCTLLMDKPGWVQYDTGDGTPATGESWGPKPSSWKLAKNLPGFIIIGGAASGLVLAIRQVTAWRCRALAKGAITGSGTKTVDNIKPISGLMPVVDSDAELSAENTHTYDVDNNANVRIEWIENENQWEIYQADCPV